MSAIVITEQKPNLIGFDRVLKWIAAGALVSIPLIVAVCVGYDSFVEDAIHFNVISGMGMWGTFVVHMATRPSRKEIGITLLLGLAMRLLYDVAIGEKGYAGSLLIAMGTFLGLASIVVLVIQAVRVKTERRAMIRRSLGVLATFNYMGFCLIFLLSFTRLALPRKLDYFLYAFDGSLGFEPSFALGRFVRAFPALDWLVGMVYNGLGLWFCIVYAAHTRVHGKFRFSILRLYIVNILIGISLYFLFPASGPRYAFPTFPNSPLVVEAGAVPLNSVPNAMPSLHLAGTLMIFWLSQPWKRLRLVTGVICVLTAVATMSTGEHYFIDLIVAVPYSLAMFALASDVRERRFPVVVGSTMVFIWLAVLRYGNIHPALSWMLVLVTIAMCFKLERRFARSLWNCAPGASGELWPATTAAAACWTRPPTNRAAEASPQ